MKNSNLKNLTLSLFLMMAMIFATSTSFAQGAPGKGRQAPPPPPPPKVQQMKMLDRIPDITEAQKTEIKKLHIALMKEIMPIQNLIREKQARLHTLSTADKVDMKAINDLIDEIGKLRTDIQKKRMKFVQDVRALLTDDQRVFFDQHMGSFMKNKGHKGPGGPRGGCRR